jgi:pimeloyl-ACP methyl ester carboxylesterase
VLEYALPRLMKDTARARKRVFGIGYENVEALPLDVARSFLEPWLGTRERARQFQRWLVSLRARDLVAVEPALSRVEAPTLIVWGTGDRFFSIKWARWLADRLPNVSDVVELTGARLFFPDERAPELVAALERHLAAAERRP